ncbi:MAG: phosphate ABC transporter ATP-binding protein, partial [Tabrizicola sp.]|nr:phosphate ABC transporter ATP-binding protein [Tabrizicola sp.]
MNDMTRTALDIATESAKIEARGVQVYYGTNHALRDVDVTILDKAVTAFIG